MPTPAAGDSVRVTCPTSVVQFDCWCKGGRVSLVSAPAGAGQGCAGGRAHQGGCPVAA